MPAKRKLTDAQVRQIRRRHHRGEHLTALAVEFHVDRKTLRRRLDALERVESEKAMLEAERAHRRAIKSLHRQVEAEHRKLLEREFELERERACQALSSIGSRMRLVEADIHALRTTRPPGGRVTGELDWLDTRKNLSGHALAETNGLIRLQNPEGTVCKWFERDEVDALVDAGWSFA
jgi:predicted RNase H-like nuclease (RuvC/YqgF family)